MHIFDKKKTNSKALELLVNEFDIQKERHYLISFSVNLRIESEELFDILVSKLAREDKTNHDLIIGYLFQIDSQKAKEVTISIMKDTDNDRIKKSCAYYLIKYDEVDLGTKIFLEIKYSQNDIC